MQVRQHGAPHACLRDPGQRLVDIHAIENELAGTADEEATARLRQFALTLKDDVQAQEVLMNELHDKTLLMRMLPLTIVFEPLALTPVTARVMVFPTSAVTGT